MIKKIVIIGAGPAGMAAALQLHRFGINTLLFAQECNKSLLKNAWGVENYLGCYPGKSGIKLLQQFQTHLAKNKITTIKARVKSLGYNAKTKIFKIKANKKNYSANHVVVASGTKPRLLIKNPPAAIRRCLFYEVFPLLKKRKKTILIVGAGDAAFDNALHLAKYNKVLIYNRAKHPNALPLLINKVRRHHNIRCFQEHRLCGIMPLSANKKNKKLAVMVANRQGNVYIELVPNWPIFTNI